MALAPGPGRSSINLQAAADLCRLAVLHFREHGSGGRIVNVASRAAYRGDSPHHWHYAASKAGHGRNDQVDCSRLRVEGILASPSAPGFTVSGMAEDYLAGRGGAKILADIPLGRVAESEEVAEIDPLARHRCPAKRDRQRNRRQRSKLCSLGTLAPSGSLPLQQISIPLGNPTVIEQPRAPIETRGRVGGALRNSSRRLENKPAPPVRIHGNTYLVGSCGISSILIVGDPETS